MGPCELTVEFVLPADKFPKNFPYGMDLDNLLKRLQDALEKTVLKDVPGRDSAIVVVHASKRPAESGARTGARLSIQEVQTFQFSSG